MSLAFTGNPNRPLNVTMTNNKNKNNAMKHKLSWVGALTLAVTFTSQLETMAVTNGPILITVRKGQDLTWGTTDSADQRGPGQVAPGDVAMGSLLADHGYAFRYLIDAELNPNPLLQNPLTFTLGDQNFYLALGDLNFEASLVINSGTSGSSDIGAPNTNGIPIIMGEHSCISDVVRASANSLYMYSGTGSDDVKNDEPAQGGTNQYMKVLLPSHPIMQGIPLLPDGTVKIFRDPYPEEGGIPGGVGPVGAHTPVGGKKNYEYAWTTINASQAAAGTQVIGVLAGHTARACFATADVGAQLADTSNDPLHPWEIQFGDNLAHQRLVHFFVNDQGSGGARRCFNALTDIGRVIFIRTVKWALGETLTPYVPLNINVSQLSPTSLQLSWNATADKNYKILGSANVTAPLFNWETLKQDIPGVNGTIQKTVDISAGPPAAYLMVASVP
jgi:hypothetical protein